MIAQEKTRGFIRNCRKSTWILLYGVAKTVLPVHLRQKIDDWRENRDISRLPDRTVLINQILPAVLRPATNTLWVGCRHYVKQYPALIERRGAVCWTLEIDPELQRWGHPQRHTVGDLQKVDAFYSPGFFDVALVNGVFGWGLDTLEGQNLAVQGLARVMKPGGTLVLGWDTDHSSDPTQLPAIQQFCIPSRHPGVNKRIVFPENPHVYDFFMRRYQ